MEVESYQKWRTSVCGVKLKAYKSCLYRSHSYRSHSYRPSSYKYAPIGHAPELEPCDWKDHDQVYMMTPQREGGDLAYFIMTVLAL